MFQQMFDYTGKNCFFKLKYSRFTLLCYFQVYSIVSQYFHRLYSIKSYYKIMAVISWAIKCILITYLFYT